MLAGQLHETYVRHFLLNLDDSAPDRSSSTISSDRTIFFYECLCTYDQHKVPLCVRVFE